MSVEFFVMNSHHQVMRTPTVQYWIKWMGNAHSSIIVGRTEIDSSIYVSTVFLGMGNSHNGSTPKMFETMIFGGPRDQEQSRFQTWDEAVKGHDAVVKSLVEELLYWICDHCGSFSYAQDLECRKCGAPRKVIKPIE